MRSRGIPRSNWYATVRKALPKYLVQAVRPFLGCSQDLVQRYAELKEALQAFYVDESPDRNWELLHLPPLGNCKPSELLADFLRLLGREKFTDMHLAMFLDKLPKILVSSQLLR